MTTIIEAVYEGGLFLSGWEVDLKEGTHVEVKSAPIGWPTRPKAVAARIGRLAAKSAAADFRKRPHAIMTGSETTERADHDIRRYRRGTPASYRTTRTIAPRTTGSSKMPSRWSRQITLSVTR